MKICPYCGAVADDNATYCATCNRAFAPSQNHGESQNCYGQHQGYNAPNGFYQGQHPYGDPYVDRNNPFDEGPEGKSRGVAALLAILLGGIGVHYFYLGKTTAGLLTILLTLVTCGLWQIITLVQGILMFCMSNVDFRNKYVLTNSTFPLF